MKSIRENVFQVTYTELGNPFERGWVDLKGEGRLLLDEADIRFIREMKEQGYEPNFFISRSDIMGGDFIVVARQWNNRV